jgi:suppressor of ftsI
MQVQESYVTPTQPRFCDVLWVPAGEERSVYMRFKEWPGKTVMHCHILPHEDQGMMTNIFIRRRRGA